MDLRLLIAVLWRFRLLVVAGTVFAVAVAGLSAVRVELRDGKPSVTQRGAETWQSSSLLLLSQEGFPWGRSTLNQVVPLKGEGDVEYAPRFADLVRFQELALIYASLASGDEVRNALLEEGPIEGQYTAEVVQTPDGSTSLPMIQISGLAASPAAATRLANRATTVFRAYIKQYQDANAIPESERVDLPVIQKAAGATLADGRSLTRPAFIFLLTMTLVVGLAFLLDNLRPRRRLPAPAADDVALVAVDRESDHERVPLRSARG